MMHSANLAYSELMICYGLVRSVMPSELHRSLYEQDVGVLLFGSKNRYNRTASLFHDEAVEMGIIRHLKSLGYSSYEEL